MKFRIGTITGFQPQAFKKYFQNTGYLLIGKVGSMLIRMVADVFIVVNYLGPQQNGIINYASSFVMLFAAVAGLGIDQLVVRDILKYPQKQGTILGTSIALKLTSAIAIIPLIALCYPLYASENTPPSYIYILSIIGIFQASTVFEAYYQSQVQAKRIMIVNVVANVLSAAVKLIFVSLSLPLEWFVWALVMDAAIIAAGYLYTYLVKTKGTTKWRIDLNLAKTLLRNSWPLMFSSTLVILYMRIDQLMIGRMLSEAELGIYSTAVRISEAWYFVPIAIVSSLFPAIIHAKQHSEEQYMKRMQALYDLMVVIGLVFSLGITLFDDLIYGLLFKPEFATGAPILSVHIWGGLFGALGMASGQYLINEGYTKLSLLRTAAGAVINIVLNIILLPIMGIMGAAVATFIAYFTATFVLLLVPETRKQGVMMVKSVLLISIFYRLKEVYMRRSNSAS